MCRCLVLTLLLLGPISSVNLSAKSFHAERFDVQAELAEDRSLRVEESVVFVFRGGEFTRVWREVPARRTDGIVDVVARMDGVALPEGTGPGQVEIRRGSRVKVTWHFAPTRGMRSFSLSYRLLGVATRGQAHDLVDWIALPDEHGYQVDAARVTLRVPAGSALASSVEVRPRNADVLAGPDGVTITTGRLMSDATVRITLKVSSAALDPAPPQWQARQAERASRGPWMLIVAGAILLAGLGWIGAFSSGWSGPQPGASHGGAVTTPPASDLPAAAAARLAGHGSRLSRLLATLVELADRGIVRVEERAGAARVFGRTFDVVLVALPSSPQPHEAAALALLFGASPQAGARVSWRRVQQDVNNKGGRFASALLETMRRYGYVDPDRVAGRKTLVRALVFVGALALVSLAGAGILIPMLGGWGFVVPGALALVAIAMGIVLGRFSLLTPRGEADAGLWRAFYRHLATSVAPKGPARPVPASWLAMAVGMGVGHHAAKRMAGKTPLPRWFRATATGADEGHASFAALLSTATASSAHADGDGSGDGGASAAASTAAAGGGSSGAS